MIDDASEAVQTQTDRLSEEKDALKQAVTESESQLQSQQAVVQSNMANGAKTVQAMQRSTGQLLEESIGQLQSMANQQSMKLNEQATKDEKQVSDQVRADTEQAKAKIAALIEELNNA